MDAVPAPDVRLISARLEAVARFREPDRPGWPRRVPSAPDRAMRAELGWWMADCSLVVRLDAAGTVIGERGQRPGRRLAVTGSPTGTVDGGGRFDAMGGVEPGWRRRSSSTWPGAGSATVCGSCCSSAGSPTGRAQLSGHRAVTGHLQKRHLALRDPAGQSLAGALAADGADPAQIGTSRWGTGRWRRWRSSTSSRDPSLSAAVIRSGWSPRCTASPRSSPGSRTTPMDSWRDALAAAVGTVVEVERSARAGEARPRWGASRSSRAPRTWCRARPSCRAKCAARRRNGGRPAASIRSGRSRRRERGAGWRVSDLALRGGGGRDPPPGSCGDRERGRGARDPCSTAGERHRARRRPPRPAGADGHDLRAVAGGRSHCPGEWTEPAAISSGFAVLVAAIGQLDDSEMVRPQGTPAA